MISNRQCWLVTGSTGFLGQAVLELLTRRPDLQIVRLVRPGHRLAGTPGTIVADPGQPQSWLPDLHNIQPGIVLHLAGRTPPASAEELFTDNLELTRQLLRGLDLMGRPVRLVHAGSAAELGNVPVDQLPVHESYLPEPVTPYGQSKWAAAQAVMAAGNQIRPVVARIFNIIGPGQATSQAFGRYAADLFRADPAKPLQIMAMGLKHRRDFIDIRDVARALVTLAEYPNPARLYHVGRGESRSVGEGLDVLVRASGKKVDIIESQGGGSLGPADSRADVRRIRADTGWVPQISFEQSLIDLWSSIAAGRP